MAGPPPQNVVPALPGLNSPPPATWRAPHPTAPEHGLPRREQAALPHQVPTQLQQHPLQRHRRVGDTKVCREGGGRGQGLVSVGCTQTAVSLQALPCSIWICSMVLWMRQACRTGTQLPISLRSLPLQPGDSSTCVVRRLGAPPAAHHLHLPPLGGARHRLHPCLDCCHHLQYFLAP